MKSILFIFLLSIISTTSFAGFDNVITCETVFGDSVTLSQKKNKFTITSISAEGKRSIYKNLRELSAEAVLSQYNGIDRVITNKNESVLLGIILEEQEANAYNSILVVHGFMAAAKCQYI